MEIIHDRQSNVDGLGIRDCNQLELVMEKRQGLECSYLWAEKSISGRPIESFDCTRDQ